LYIWQVCLQKFLQGKHKSYFLKWWCIYAYLKDLCGDDVEFIIGSMRCWN
jgi:hypothetical protein